STKSLLGSAMSGEGLVNVYRGSGKVLISPVAATASLWSATNAAEAKAAAKNSNTLGH
ncbi:MAG: AIM24 family protein, partial [Oscillospiraceae bacterium]|nr:AIM24 family protein [Oscillospiraceae bacterium]